MRGLLIPVKNLERAKQRLSPHLAQPERTVLAQAMFEDVCAAAAGVRAADRIFLVSNWEPALERARSLGWKTIWEGEQQSESASVDYASRLCAERGVAALLRLPIDIPLIEAADIDAVLELVAGAPSAVLVPSRRGTGTNALLRMPPALFASHFGPNSFREHVAEARRAGADCRIVRNPRIELDIDDISDVQQFLSTAGKATATRRWLERAGFTAACLPKTGRV